MSNLCQKLHLEFTKVKVTYAQALEEQAKFLKGESTEEEVTSRTRAIQTQIEEYENVCKTLCKLPDGRAIWATDFIALENLASLNELDINLILNLIPADGIDNESTRLSKLDLSELPITDLGHSLNGLSKLTELNLARCAGLLSLGNSLGKLVNLTELNLSNCTGLKSLGKSLNKLENLTWLNLRNCSGLKFLGNSLDKLENLTWLTLGGCKGLKSLGNSLDNLVNLTDLSLQGCAGLTSLEDSLDKLVKLTRLILIGCPAGKNVKEVRSLRTKLPNCKIVTK